MAFLNKLTHQGEGETYKQYGILSPRAEDGASSQGEMVSSVPDLHKPK